MPNGPKILVLSDGAAIHKGDKKTVSATFLDKDDAAAVPTDGRIEFIPPSGTDNKTVYAIVPGAGEEALVMASNVGTAAHTFDEKGWWDVVAYGEGNIEEVEPARVFVEDVPS